MYMIEIEGDLQLNDYYPTLNDAKVAALQECENNGATQCSLVIYKLTPVVEGEVAVKADWKPWKESK